MAAPVHEAPNATPASNGNKAKRMKYPPNGKHEPL